MTVRINTNVDALQAQRNLSLVGQDFSSAVAKLSSGLRINSAADDAAGLAISEKLKSQISGFDQGGRNAQDAISMIQTGEGALNTTHGILQRMRELAVQAANDSYTSSDRANIQSEINQLIQEVDRIAQQTDFNTKKLLDGSAGGAQVSGGGPDVKAISAQAQVALNGTFGIVAASGPNVDSAAVQSTYQAIRSQSGAVAAGTVLSTITAGAASMNVSAGDGTTYTFNLDATGQNLTVTGAGGKGNGFTTTTTMTSGVTVQAFLDTVNSIADGSLHAAFAAGSPGFFILQDTEAGITSSANPGGPQALTIAGQSGVFNSNQFFNAATSGIVTNQVGTGFATSSAYGNGVQAAVVKTGTTNATRSALESSRNASGSFFTQTSSMTITGATGTQTFTAQAGQSLETFFQQVNGSGIGVTMAVNQNDGKVLLYNNNYGIFSNTLNPTGATAVSVRAATGDFAGGTTQTPGALNMGFDTATGPAASIDSNLNFITGTAAVNAQVTLTDPTNALGNTYSTITATGANSDQLAGTGGLSGMVITLANPGNIQADSWTVKENAALNFQVGANANQTVNLQIDAATSQTLGVTSLDVLTTQDAETAITQLDRAIQSVSSTRANMGAVINRLTNSMNNDMSASQNASAANSRIRDVDVARQTVDFTRDQILLQAGTAVLAQANQAPTSILSLLR